MLIVTALYVDVRHAQVFYVFGCCTQAAAAAASTCTYNVIPIRIFLNIIFQKSERCRDVWMQLGSKVHIKKE